MPPKSKPLPTDTGDAPAVGSWIEYTHDNGWLSTLYVDLAGPHATATDTLITPLGNLNIPTSVDAALGLFGLNSLAPIA